MNRKAKSSTLKSLSSLAVVLCISWCICIFISGCSGTVSNQPDPAPAAEVVPFTESTMAITGDGESLFSFFIDAIADGLQEGLGGWIVDNSLGRIFDIITHQEGQDTASQLSAMNSKLDSIEKNQGNIAQQLHGLALQLQLNETTIVNYITTTALGEYVSNITACYSTAGYTSLMGISNLSLNPAIPSATLQGYVTTFITAYSYEVPQYIQGIHDLICPPFAAVPQGVLRNFADYILENMPPPATGTDAVVLQSNAATALAAYQLLETYFAQILNYQTQALTVATEISNHLDPTGALAGTYLNGTVNADGTVDLTGTYKQILTDEVNQFLLTVNYLMLNTVDYRTQAKFGVDAPYMTTQGIAPDVTYTTVYARSRYFAAQALKSFVPATANPNNFGMVGSVVVPKNYSPGTMSPITTMTVQFTGPQEGTPTTFSKTVTATNVPSQFPYTQWDNATAQCSPDNNWSFYEFNGFGDLTAGTYTMSLVENPDGTVPWSANSTNLGTISIKYYDPSTFDPSTATMVANATNTIKFGYISGRWDWGYSRLSGSPMGEWLIPKKFSSLNNMLGNGSSNPGPAGYVTVSPTPTTPGRISAYELQLSKYEINAWSSQGWEGAQYEIQLPITVSAAPGDQSGQIASAEVFTNSGGTYSINRTNHNSVAPQILSTMTLNDRTNRAPIGYLPQIAVAQSTNTTENGNGTFTVQNSVIAGTDYGNNLWERLVVDDIYDFTVYGAYFGYEPYIFLKGTLQGSLNAYWNTQIVYTNKYTVIQQ